MNQENATTKNHYWITYSLIALNLAVFFFITFKGADTNSPLDILSWGGNFAPYTLDSQWWRLVSSIFLHYGLLHLSANIYSLYYLGRDVEQVVGRLTFILVYFITGVFGSIISCYWNLFSVGAGASGAIFGLYGFYLVLLLTQSYKEGSQVSGILINFLLYMAVMTYLGANFNFDNAAHFGGLLAGILCAILYVLVPGKQFIPYFIIAVIGLPTAYFAVPRFQVNYFSMFQVFIRLDEETDRVMRGSYNTDDEYKMALAAICPRWDSLKISLHNLSFVPATLQADTSLLTSYSNLKKRELEYLITGIEKESFVYYDSLEHVRSLISKLPALQYSLGMDTGNSDEVKKEDEEPNEKQLQVIKQWYDSTWTETSDSLNAHYYRIGFKDSLDEWHGPALDFYDDGGIQMKGHYKHGLQNGIFLYYTKDSTYDAAGRYKDEFKVGKWEYYHTNGSLASEIRHQNGISYVINVWDSVGVPQVVDGYGKEVLRHKNGTTASVSIIKEGIVEGEVYGYYENGKPYFKEYYENGRLVGGVAYTPEKEKFTYDYSTYIPRPVNGYETFYAYVDKNKKYPLPGNDTIQGNVKMIFSVSTTGKIEDIKFLERLGNSYDNEAKRLLLNGPAWIPARLHGHKPIETKAVVEIHFP